jgi:glucose/arabinose dehydrogenase
MPAASAASRSATASITAVSTVDPTHVTIVLEQVAAGFKQPLFLTHAGDGSNRTFVVEKDGQIKLLDGTRFLDVVDRITTNGYEQGLLVLAFHPEFATNGLFFVYYTAPDGANTLSRFRATADLQRGDPDTERVLLQQASPHETHNGGMIAFGPDGMLYIGLGDGGGANDQFGNGQNGDTFLAKILRINVNGAEPYAVPQDNPFVNDAQIRPETWAWGLRNPWRFSFDRATGDLYIGDVGQNQWEEINFQPAISRGGANYGWSIKEGSYCFYTTTCDSTGLTDPIVAYDRHQGIAVTGGYVYRGQQVPALYGAYLFGDYGTGRIWAAARDTGSAWTTTPMTRFDGLLSSFGEDEAGELYLTDLSGGGVFRITIPQR